jgi:tRNA A22 N-methylase
VFNPKTWQSVQNAANIRKTLSSDSYAMVTEDIIIQKDSSDTFAYHSACLKRYTAVKTTIE